jgi:hypothetical protein
MTRKHEDKNKRILDRVEEVFVFVERNRIKYFVSENRALIKVPCASRHSDVDEPHVAREPRCGTPDICL